MKKYTLIMQVPGECMEAYGESLKANGYTWEQLCELTPVGNWTLWRIECATSKDRDLAESLL